MTSSQSDLPKTAHFDSSKILRTWMTGVFLESMRCIDVRNVLTHRISLIFGCLQIGAVSYPLSTIRRIVLIAAGKAAVPMCSITAEILRPGLRADQALTGVAVGPGARESLPSGFSHFPGSHPFPTQTSWDAAEKVQEILRPLDCQDLVIFLISGGASSMMEMPLEADISVREIQDFYRTLVYSGLSIREINVIRKHLSAIKGGRLAQLAAPSMQCTLIISDAPQDSLDTVGSGPSMPDRSTVKDCQEILLKNPSLCEALSPAVRRLLFAPDLPETPKFEDSCFNRSRVICLLSNESLLEQVRLLAGRSGYHVETDNSCDDWNYQQASDFLMERILRLRKRYSKVCLLSGGEICVKVSHPSGLGGRNQHFALYTALQLDRVEPYIAALSAGSDGVDGNSPAAGATVDSFTVDNAKGRGLNPEKALSEFDSYSVFHALGTAIVTGPTGNNVRDIRIFLTQ